METRIYIKELPCYQRKGNASEKSIRVMEQHFYNLELLEAEGQKKEVEAFIRSRGNELSMTTVDADIILYNVLVRFMKEKYSLLDSFRAVPEEVLVKKFKAWLLDHGYQITRKHFMKSMGRNLQEEAGPVKYLRLLLQFLEPEDKRPEWEKDVWNLENLGFEVRQNPIDIIRTIKFTGIRQEAIREEIKRASYIRIKYLSVGSLQGEIRAVRRFSEFLAERNPEITSLGEVGRGCCTNKVLQLLFILRKINKFSPKKEPIS